MVHTIVSEDFINFTLIYTADHVFPVLPTKDLIDNGGKPTMTFKLLTGTKNSKSRLRVLVCPCVGRKSTAHVIAKLLNMCHQAQKVFCGIFVGIPKHQKGYLVYVTHIQKIISS